MPPIIAEAAAFGPAAIGLSWHCQPPPTVVRLMPALRFDNAFVRELPADPEQGPRVRQVQARAVLARRRRRPVRAPRLVAHSREVAALLGFAEDFVRSPQFAEVFAGNALLDGMQPYAANYGGHQFGNWAGQLGDGRAITLGETVNAAGERWELQLKGAGPTPYSRTADGRAVLRSSVREFLCSEAMHHLGVPTTRALSPGRDRRAGGARHVLRRPPGGRARRGGVPRRAVVHPLRQLRAAGLARRERRCSSSWSTSPSAATSRSCDGDGDALRERWFGEVCERTAEMIAHWMRVGFVHGVMNTDNMSILGLTIDYGPYGWIDDFDPDWTPNTTDRDRRRYRFGQQPQVAFWNLSRLAGALLPLFDGAEPLQAGLQRYAEAYARIDRQHYRRQARPAATAATRTWRCDAVAARAAARGRGRHDAVLPRLADLDLEQPATRRRCARPSTIRTSCSATAARRSRPGCRRYAQRARRGRHSRRASAARA